MLGQQCHYFVSALRSGPPRIILSPQNTEVLEGSTAELQCRASGYPVPDIAWTKNGGRLPSLDRHILLPSGTLRVVRASTSDQGQYVCRAINVIGVVLARALLTVRPRGMCSLLVGSSLHRTPLLRRQEPKSRTLHLPHWTNFFPCSFILRASPRGPLTQ